MDKQLVEKILEKPCLQANIGYAGWLKLSFGEKRYYKIPRLRNAFHGEIDLSISTLSWRLISKEQIIAGSYDENEFINSQLPILEGKKLIKLAFPNHGLSVSFEDDLVLEVIHSSAENNDSIVFLFSDLKLAFVNNGRKWQLMKSDEPPKNRNTKEIDPRDQFSLETTQRWAEKQPPKCEKGACRDCAYYLRIVGEYYFWDYGICGNQYSPFDGKAVHVHSYCENFDAELKTNTFDQN